jgi:hypothetical protein
MKMFSRSIALLLIVAATGCGSGAQGPAKPEDTPVVSQDEVMDSYTKGMPPDVKKRYDQMYKK